MAYPPLAPSRRTRRRRWLFAALIVVIVIALVALVVRYRTEQRAVTEYLAVADEVALTEAAVADSLADLLDTITDVTRPELMERLNRLASQSEAAAAELAAVAVPPPVAEVHGFLAVAVASWTKALLGAPEAVMTILDEPDAETGPLLLDGVFDDLRVGDTAYEGFQAAIDELDDDLVTREFDTVAFTPTDDEASYDAQAVALRLRSVYRLGQAHDLSVTGFTDPESVAVRDDIPVVPFSETFTVHAVVANEGNEPESAIQVSMALTPVDGGEGGATFSDTIEELVPGTAKTVTFNGIELRPGGLYEVVISAPLGTDEDPDNNTWRLVFYRNEDT